MMRSLSFPIIAVALCGCISARQSLTPEAAKVRYVEGNHDPECELLGEVTVGRALFVFDERQPAKSHAGRADAPIGCEDGRQPRGDRGERSAER
ncbi:MAG: hypothetical protein ACOC1F_05070 [Myxococcota bacterium]